MEERRDIALELKEDLERGDKAIDPVPVSTYTTSKGLLIDRASTFTLGAPRAVHKLPEVQISGGEPLSDHSRGQSRGYTVEPLIRKAYTYPGLRTIKEASQSVRDEPTQSSSSPAGANNSTESSVHERADSSEHERADSSEHERADSSEHERADSSEHERADSSEHEPPNSSVHERANLSEHERLASSGGKRGLSWPLRNHRASLIIPIEDCGPHRTAAYVQALKKQLLGEREAGKSDSIQGSASPETDTPDSGRWRRKEDDELFEVSFAEMQRMKLRKLQYRLVEHAVSIHCDAIEPDSWEDDLKKYTEAVRDYDYMLERGEKPEDPFLATSQNFLDHYVIQTFTKGKNFEKRHDVVKIPLVLKNESQPIIDVRNRYRSRAWTHGFRQRLQMATVGGVFLIGPMWLMVKRNDQTTSLISTTAFVAAFGMLMAYSIDSPEKVMSATAAYAAVLVVFVGLGGTPGDSA